MTARKPVEGEEMNITVIIATYGADEWRDLAWSRAYPSAAAQEPAEILVGHEPLGTVATSRNGLAERATADWILFLDADDELAPGFLAAMRRAVEGRVMDDGPEPLFTPAVSYVRKNRSQAPQFLDRGISLEQDNWLVVGTLVSNRLFHEVGGFEDYPHGFEDWSVWAKCWKAGAEIVKVPDAVYLAHISPNSKHRQGWRDRKWQVETHMRIQKELFPA